MEEHMPKSISYYTKLDEEAHNKLYEMIRAQDKLIDPDGFDLGYYAGLESLLKFVSPPFGLCGEDENYLQGVRDALKVIDEIFDFNEDNCDGKTSTTRD
jgi:hypothetical protein